MKAEIIASGTELLLGQIADTNTSFIANQLAILGIDLYYASIVGLVTPISCQVLVLAIFCTI